MQTDDTHILNLLRNPDRQDEGFRLLMKRYGEAVYWHIRRIVVGHDDAEDVLHGRAEHPRHIPLTIYIHKSIKQSLV